MSSLVVATAVAAETVVVDQSASGEIFIPVFDTGLGTLTQVDVVLTLDAGVPTAAGGSHSHAVSPAPVSPEVTGNAGGHSHSTPFPVYSGGGLSFPAFGVNTLAAGIHSHSIAASASSTAAGGSHSHTLPQYQDSFVYTGGDLAPFLAVSDFTIATAPPGSAANGNHVHSYTGGSTGNAGSHSHLVGTLAWSTETTFTYTPHPAAPLLGAGARGVLGVLLVLTTAVALVGRTRALRPT